MDLAEVGNRNVVGNPKSSRIENNDGTMNNTSWHGDPGRSGFNPNEKGFGMVAETTLTNRNYVKTGWPLSLPANASYSVMWWHNHGSGFTGALAYMFGGSGASFRCYLGSPTNTFFKPSNGIANVLCTTPILTTANNNRWIHIAVVVNGVTKRVQWYVDGMPAGGRTYTGTAAAVTNTEFRVGMHTSTSSTYARQAAYDDFRFYTKALTRVQILAAMATENASTGTFGNGCGASVPKINAVGQPKTGNVGFQLSLSGGARTQLMALALGTKAHLGGTAPVAIAALGTGCQLESNFDLLLVIGMTSATGTHTFPLPIPGGDPVLIGFHAYATYLHGPLGTGAATPTMDINIQQ